MVQAREFKHDTREGILVNAVSKMWINWLLSKWIKHKKNQYCTFTYFIPPSPHIFSLLPPVTSPIVPLMSLLSLFPSKIHGKEHKSSKRQGWLWAWCASGNTAQALKDEEKRVCNLMVSYNISDAFLTSHINDTSALLSMTLRYLLDTKEKKIRFSFASRFTLNTTACKGTN